MKRLIIFVLVIGGLFTSLDISAQTIDDADARHTQLTSMILEKSPQPEIYSVLFQCYKDYVIVINTVSAGSADYTRAKNGLLEIHPLLDTAACYYSSQGQNKDALIFAQSFIDITQMEAFADVEFACDDRFVRMAYFAASGTFNNRDYKRAIKYFDAYLSSGDKSRREVVYSCMADACKSIGNKELELVVLEAAIEEYPTNFELLARAINRYLDKKDSEKLQYYLTLAFNVDPYHESLLTIQGKLYEDNNEFKKALDVYNTLKSIKGNSMTITQHIALNNYNLGVLNRNQATLQDNENDARNYATKAQEYFVAAASNLESVVSNDPNSIKYLQALAISYDQIGREADFNNTNNRLISKGASPVMPDTVPLLIHHSSKESDSTSKSSTVRQKGSDTGVVSKSLLTSQAKTIVYEGDDVPPFSEFAKHYVEPNINKWQQKNDFETLAEYQARVSEDSRNARIKELMQVAQDNYINAFKRNINIKELTLKPYDAENEVFLVESEYGEMIVPVPRDKDQARMFQDGWSGMQIKSPKFYINTQNDRLEIASLTFVTPTGSEYYYDNKRDIDYTEVTVDLNFDSIDKAMIAAQASSQNSMQKSKKETVSIGKASSDVDLNIPELKRERDNVYALIIANENYDFIEDPVEYAHNDGDIFAEYCKKTLGIPERRVKLYKDATFGHINAAKGWVRQMAEACGSDMQLLVYYAGHGVNNESTKDAYILPTDAEGKSTDVCISLKGFYNDLASMNMSSVVVFMDACFSGDKRGGGGGVVSGTRAIVQKPKSFVPTGNMVIFSAVSDVETAMPYREKGHGLFTYYLLKKLQETGGDVTLQELYDYLENKVIRMSREVNEKPQTPTVIVSPELQEKLMNRKLVTDIVM